MRLRWRKIDAGSGNPFLGGFPIRKGGDATVGLAGALDEIQNGLHRRGPFANNDGTADRSFGIRRRGSQPRGDGIAHPHLSHTVEIPDAIERGIEIRVDEKFLAGAEKFVVCDHALADGNGEPSLGVNGNPDGHSTEKRSYICSTEDRVQKTEVRGQKAGAAEIQKLMQK